MLTLIKKKIKLQWVVKVFASFAIVVFCCLTSKKDLKKNIKGILENVHN